MILLSSVSLIALIVRKICFLQPITANILNYILDKTKHSKEFKYIRIPFKSILVSAVKFKMEFFSIFYHKPPKLFANVFTAFIVADQRV